MTKKKVVVGLSGGVDSSVAAALLKELGYDVIGLYMNNWEEESDICPGAYDWEDVIAVCGVLDIPHYSIKFAKEYREQVFAYFLRELRAGNTPNPDVLCNRQIKFGVFAEYAKKLGADLIATGHYCGLSDVSKYPVPFLQDGNTAGQKAFLRAQDDTKDQSYFLNQVSSEQFAKVLFPLYDIPKTKVREIAQKYKFVNSAKKDSTGICFIGERNFRNFLQGYLPNTPGDMVEMGTNKRVGQHIGLMYYTLGQRRGLGIGGLAEDAKGGENGRWFVAKKNLDTN
ncbi:MAG: tRNA 2-thiouridine(34) synthase MnmA, partial [Firmicutes bacterium]|nr:tRNA 2-thiouridine(34) synthase MnmA [Bacillota bacterium]